MVNNHLLILKINSNYSIMSLFYQQKTFIRNLINLCKECNAIALSIYNDYLQNDIDITYKEDDSPLTHADLEVNRHICNELKKMNKAKGLDECAPIRAESDVRYNNPLH